MSAAQQPELFEPTHATRSPERLSNTTERIYYDTWVHENTRRPAINGGYTLLEHILADPPAAGPHWAWQRYAHIRPVSNRDSIVAASLAQWLGTNCGLGFLIECERKARRFNPGEMTLRAYDQALTPEDVRDRAALIALLVRDHPMRARLEAEIVAAMDAAAVGYAYRRELEREKHRLHAEQQAAREQLAALRAERDRTMRHVALLQSEMADLTERRRLDFSVPLDQRGISALEAE